MPEMIFPDNRFKSPTSYSGFGLTYACDEVRAGMDELETLLAQAKAARLLTTHVFTADEGHPIAVAAQAVFNQAKNENLVIYTDEACADWSARLHDASTRLKDLLTYQKTEQVAYVPPSESPYNAPEAPDTLDKLKPLFIAGAVIAGAILLIPIVTEITGISKTFRKTRRKS